MTKHLQAARMLSCLPKIWRFGYQVDPSGAYFPHLPRIWPLLRGAHLQCLKLKNRDQMIFNKCKDAVVQPGPWKQTQLWPIDSLLHFLPIFGRFGRASCANYHFFLQNLLGSDFGQPAENGVLPCFEPELRSKVRICDRWGKLVAVYHGPRLNRGGPLSRTMIAMSI